MTTEEVNQTRVFLCSHNSVRSQMGEAILRKYAGAYFEVHSAGIKARGIQPNTIKVMEEAGYDLSDQFSKTLDRTHTRPSIVWNIHNLFRFNWYMTNSNIAGALAGQLASCLNKLEKIITITSEDMWKTGNPPFWQIVFHIINSLDSYFATFNPEISNPEHDYSLPDNLTKYAEFGFFDNKPENLETTLISKDELQVFLNLTRKRMRECFNNEIERQFDDPSGFSWIPFTKYELILHNLRHIAEHNGVLDQRLKAAGSEYVGWLGRGEL